MNDRESMPYDAFGDHAPIEGMRTEGDYISREAAVRELEFRCKILTVRGGKTAADILTRYGIKTIRNRDGLPAADVKPVVRSYWERVPDGGYVCHKCRNRPFLDGSEEDALSDYCPHCGARMEE